MRRGLRQIRLYRAPVSAYVASLGVEPGTPRVKKSVDEGMEPDDPVTEVRVERRRRPRPDDSSSDWESIALRRISHHVRSLPPAAEPAHGANDDQPWEDAVVRVLRRHLRGLESEE
jgi:hypothetical protein